MIPNFLCCCCTANIEAECAMPFSIAALVLADENGENFQSYSSFWQLWCVGTVAPSTDQMLFRLHSPPVVAQLHSQQI